jgi:hypothetical protein
MDERRGKVSRYNRDPAFKKQVDEERRARFLAKKAEEEAAIGPSRFRVIIPVNPMGMPEYDGGERFDLRLPHVDNGWVDPDADFGKQVGRFFGGLFGGGKKGEEGGDGK